VARADEVVTVTRDVPAAAPHDEELDPSFVESGLKSSGGNRPSSRPVRYLPGDHVLRQWMNYRQQGLIDERP
jgi:hypothetical protein